MTELNENPASESNAPAEGSSKDKALEEQLTTLTILTESLKKQEELGKALIGDEQFRKFMELKNSGKEIEVKEKTEETPIDPMQKFFGEANTPVDPDGEPYEFSQTELIKKIAEMGREQTQQVVDSALKPLQESNKHLVERLAQKDQEETLEAIRTDIASAAKTFPDFADYHDDMQKTHERFLEHGRLSAEEYYLLSKIKKHGFPTEQSPLFSERPHNVLGTTRQISREKLTGSSRSRFSQLLSEKCRQRYG